VFPFYGALNCPVLKVVGQAPLFSVGKFEFVFISENYSRHLPLFSNKRFAIIGCGLL
jgi:hypothetical protein